MMDKERHDRISNDGRQQPQADLKKRYLCITRNPLMKFIIKNSFDNNINFND